MKVEVLSMDGLDKSALGWRLSRDLSDEVGWQGVFDVDVPVNEMPSAMINFSGMTILEREIFASPRMHVMWARTSHVDDPLEFTVPREFMISDQMSHFIDSCRESMRAGKAAGQSQDEWRFFLPIISQTAWTTRISFRDLVKLTCYFDYLSDVLPHPTVRLRFLRLRGELMSVLDDFTGSAALTDKAMKSYSKAKFLYEGRLPDRIPRIETESLFLLQFDLPIWLRAQIVRHRNLTFTDDFFVNVLCAPQVLTTTIGEQVRMEVAVTKEVWRTIMSKRSCWIAQDTLKTGKDYWQDIIDSFGWTVSMLPCADGHCPYHKDASLRITPADPGAPCPRWLTINNIDHAPYREEMIGALGSRHASWKEQVR